jgi:lipopolysaccharide export system permease protein
MRLIDRYLLRQMLGPTILATLALTTVALLSQSLSALDLIVNQRQSAVMFAKITLLAMPQLINMVLPVALFVAALVSLNRLHTEQEIVVCFAGGMSRARVIGPAMRLACTMAFLALVMNLFVQPASLRAMREAYFAVNTDLASALVREGEFASPVPGVTVYAQSIDNRGVIHNLFVFQVKDDGADTTYTAAEGRLMKRNGRPVLYMHKGTTQEFNKRGVLNYLTFDDYPFDLTPLSQTDELIHYKPSDRYLHELFFPDLQQDWERRNRERLLAEGTARLATPLYNIAAVAMALAAILGGGFSRLGYGRRIAVTAAAAAGVRILGFVIQAACETEGWLNVLQFAPPLVATAVALRMIFRKRVPRAADQPRIRVRSLARAAA